MPLGDCVLPSTFTNIRTLLVIIGATSTNEHTNHSEEASWFPESELYYHYPLLTNITLYFLPELVIIIWILDQQQQQHNRHLRHSKKR